MWRAFSQAVVFLYLLDEETSLLVLVPTGIATVIEVREAHIGLYLLIFPQLASGFVNRFGFIEYFWIKGSVLGDVMLHQWVTGAQHFEATTLSGNSIQLPFYAALRSGRMESSAALQRKYQDSYFWSGFRLEVVCKCVFQKPFTY
jgi:hypothetical protein